MLFNSIEFLVFLPAALLLYALLPARFRWILLLLASYCFYGFWKVEYLGLIAFSTLVDFLVARTMGHTKNDSKRKLLLFMSLTSNLGLLFFFKYFHWFLDGVLLPVGLLSEPLTQQLHEQWSFLLPVGISFYTFQTMGYTIDVYFRRAVPEKNLARFALFVSFFPQLVAGPIERFSNLHHQLFKGLSLSYANLQHGLRLILYGLFIKMCVADNISPMADAVFANAENASLTERLLGMTLFAVQIFSDFHGYSLIAIGTARLFGIHLMDNFRSPYLATSIRAFWSRWHISLSTWFRDYLFIPLGGSRAARWRVAANISVVFIVSGLWHGANWTFVVWGGLHAFGYLAEKVTWNSPAAARFIPAPFRWFITLSIVVVAWVFFRADSIAAALSFLNFSHSGEGMNLNTDPWALGFAALFLWSDLVFGREGFHLWIDRKPLLVRWACYGLLLYFICGFAGMVNHPFIYFQF